MSAVAGTALAVAMFWPIVRHPASRIPADIGDPTLQAWQIAWAGHILKSDPGQLWHANAFHPEQYSYAFSDTLLGYAPAGLLGTGPLAAVVRYNCVFVLAFALAFTGAYALVRQLGAGRLAAAVTGVGFAYAPWHWNQAGHLHVLSTGGIVLSLAMLARGHGFTLRSAAETYAAEPPNASTAAEPPNASTAAEPPNANTAAEPPGVRCDPAGCWPAGPWPPGRSPSASASASRSGTCWPGWPPPG